MDTSFTLNAKHPEIGRTIEETYSDPSADLKEKLKIAAQKIMQFSEQNISLQKALQKAKEVCSDLCNKLTLIIAYLKTRFGDERMERVQNKS